MIDIIPWPRELIIEIYKKSLDGGFRDDILEMMLEAYKALENDYSRSPVILAGETLHRVNCEFILWYAEYFGEFSWESTNKKTKIIVHRDDISGDFRAAETLLDKLSFNESINALKELNLIDDETFLDMHALRYLRNQIVHASYLPRLDPYNEPITTREELEETLSSPDIPLKWRKHQFQIKIGAHDMQYIVDQVRLGIDIEKKNQASSIPLALLFSSMKYIYNEISPTSSIWSHLEL